MDFFAHQDAARRRTKLLLIYYSLAVIGLALASYIAVLLVLDVGLHAQVNGRPMIWNLRLFAWTSGGTLAIVAIGTIFRMLDLREGGRAVAEMLGGEPLALSPTDERERTLRNVVEEIAIASGVPVPEIYVLRHERGINAFAAGYSEADTAVAVTRGCLEKLSRDELQGVIAHEFSHVLNGDMRLNIRLLAVLNGILGIYLFGRMLMDVDNWFDVDGRRKGSILTGAGLILVAAGALGGFFARLIQSAVSRQREFLADASAVQFTRNPNGIANALKKIGGLPSGSKLRNPQAEAASHFFFSNGLSESWLNLMATHPPLPERIKRIDPGFDGMFPVLPEDTAPDISPKEIKLRAPLDAAALSALAIANAVPRQRIARPAGQPMRIQYAAGMIEALPAELKNAATDALSATALVFALVLHRSADVRDKQLQQLSAKNAVVAQQAEAYGGIARSMDTRSRLPLLNLCLPALRKLSREQWQQFRSILEELICCDAQVDLSEFVLRRVIERNIDARWKPKEAAVVQFYSFLPLAGDCTVLLSALAHVGDSDETAIQQAFDNGVACLPANLQVPLVPAALCGVEQIDAALTRLSQAVPHIKKVVLEACARAVACDGLINANEAELLRAIAESLGCPIPPFVEGV